MICLSFLSLWLPCRLLSLVEVIPVTVAVTTSLFATPSALVGCSASIWANTCHCSRNLPAFLSHLALQAPTKAAPKVPAAKGPAHGAPKAPIHPPVKQAAPVKPHKAEAGHRMMQEDPAAAPKAPIKAAPVKPAPKAPVKAVKPAPVKGAPAKPSPKAPVKPVVPVKKAAPIKPAPVKAAPKPAAPVKKSKMESARMLLRKFMQFN